MVFINRAEMRRRANDNKTCLKYFMKMTGTTNTEEAIYVCRAVYKPTQHEISVQVQKRQGLINTIPISTAIPEQTGSSFRNLPTIKPFLL